MNTPVTSEGSDDSGESPMPSAIPTKFSGNSPIPVLEVTEKPRLQAVINYAFGRDDSNTSSLPQSQLESVSSDDPTTPKISPPSAELRLGTTISGTTKKNANRPAPARRRIHCKSRLGCFSCKRRRVKCNEARPYCSPCKRLGLRCEYPTAANNSTRGADEGTSREAQNAAGLLPAVPSVLQMEDLRFFHQFIRVAFPALPLKGEALWNEFAAMSYHYEHLAHALLGLGASHVSQNANLDSQEQALQHRVTAIKLVNEQLSCLPAKTVDADALLASIICLVAQSSLMPDSMMEYVTMTRGANLVYSTIPNKENSLFGPMSTEEHIRRLREMVTEQPKDLELIGEFLSSVLNLRGLCRTPYELRYFNCMIAAVNALRISGSDAWEEFVTLFLMPAFFTNEEFTAFVDSKNHIGRLLIIHMFLFDYLAGRMSFDPSGTPKTAGRKFVIISWTRKVASQLPMDYQPYMSWPLNFCEQLTRHDARHLLTP